MRFFVGSRVETTVLMSIVAHLQCYDVGICMLCVCSLATAARWWVQDELLNYKCCLYYRSRCMYSGPCDLCIVVPYIFIPPCQDYLQFKTMFLWLNG